MNTQNTNKKAKCDLIALSTIPYKICDFIVSSIYRENTDGLAKMMLALF